MSLKPHLPVAELLLGLAVPGGEGGQVLGSLGLVLWTVGRSARQHLYM